MPQYPQAIKDAVNVLCVELIKHYPQAFAQTYDNHGFPIPNGSVFQQRMEMGVYLELLKAGVIPNVED